MPLGVEAIDKAADPGLRLKRAAVPQLPPASEFQGFLRSRQRQQQQQQQQQQEQAQQQVDVEDLWRSLATADQSPARAESASRTATAGTSHRLGHRPRYSDSHADDDAYARASATSQRHRYSGTTTQSPQPRQYQDQQQQQQQWRQQRSSSPEPREFRPQRQYPRQGAGATGGDRSEYRTPRWDRGDGGGGGGGGGGDWERGGREQGGSGSSSVSTSGRGQSPPDAGELTTGLALTWLGTNSGSPTLERNVSCTLVRLPGAVHLVDVGEGTPRQLMAIKGLDPAEVDGIFVTHLHGDHCFGLGATLALLDAAKSERTTDPARRRHHVYGPPGLAALLRPLLFTTGLHRRLRLPLTVTEFVCSDAMAHPPRPLAPPASGSDDPQLLQWQQLLAGRQAGGAAAAAGAATGRRRAGSASGSGAQQREAQGQGQGGAEILVQRLAAKKVSEAQDLQNAVRAVMPRLAELEEIWRPPAAHYRNNNNHNNHNPYNLHQYNRYGAAPNPTITFCDPAEVEEYDNEGTAAASPYGSVDEDASSDRDGDRSSQQSSSSSGGPTPRRIFVAAEGLYWEVPGIAGARVRAAQLQHRLACWGYVFQEQAPYQEGCRRRKVVVLGDTVSSRPIAPLAAGCDVLSHEATFARGMEPKARVAQHSTGWMAGAFAAAVGARCLALTHFSARYREGPNVLESQQRTSRATSQREAEQQSLAVAGLLQEAASTFGRRQGLVAASDFYTLHVPLRQAAGAESSTEAEASGSWSGEEDEEEEQQQDGGRGGGVLREGRVESRRPAGGVMEAGRRRVLVRKAVP